LAANWGSIRQTKGQEGSRPSHKEGLSYRLIGRNVGLSKNTVMEIVRREGVQSS
jgi:hypothetical protein